TSGGAATRLKQMLISWELIKKNPFFGVGLEMDVFSSYLVSPDFERNVFREFPEPVHNYYLRLLVQTGVFPLILFGIISLELWRRLMKAIKAAVSSRQKLTLLAVALNVVALYIYANFQPLFYLPDIIFLSVAFSHKNNLRA
ncbi:MAG: O-antigen ligase family protein, partial [Patescibacteria group bacterium]